MDTQAWFEQFAVTNAANPTDLNEKIRRGCKYRPPERHVSSVQIGNADGLLRTFLVSVPQVDCVLRHKRTGRVELTAPRDIVEKRLETLQGMGYYIAAWEIVEVGV